MDGIQIDAIGFKEKREIQKQIKAQYENLEGAKFSEKRAIQKQIKELYIQLKADKKPDTKKPFVYSVGDTVKSKGSGKPAIVLEINEDRVVYNFHKTSSISQASKKDFEKDFVVHEDMPISEFTFGDWVELVKNGYTISEHGELIKKESPYKAGDKVIVGNGTQDNKGTVLNKDEHDTAFKDLDINEYEAVEMSDGSVQIVGHQRIELVEDEDLEAKVTALANAEVESGEFNPPALNSGMMEIAKGRPVGDEEYTELLKLYSDILQKGRDILVPKDCKAVDFKTSMRAIYRRLGDNIAEARRNSFFRNPDVFSSQSGVHIDSNGVTPRTPEATTFVEEFAKSLTLNGVLFNKNRETISLSKKATGLSALIDYACDLSFVDNLPYHLIAEKNKKEAPTSKEAQEKSYPSQLATLQKDKITVEDVEALQNDESLEDIDGRIESGEADAVELSEALDKAILKAETQKDTVDFDSLAQTFDLEILSSSNGGGIIMKDDIEVYRYSDDADLETYFDSIDYQKESLFDEVHD